MQIVMRASPKEILALLLVVIGCGIAATIMWPIIYRSEIVDIRQLKIFVPASLMFLGCGCGIVTRHPLTYLVAAASAVALVILNV